MKNFTLQILTPGGEFYNDEVEAVSMDTLTGRIQILANHIPYAAGIISSQIKIKSRAGDRYGQVSEGLLRFSHNNALIFVDSAKWTEENKEP